MSEPGGDPFDTPQQWRFLGDQARELYTQGDEFGDNAALVEAIGAQLRDGATGR